MNTPTNINTNLDRLAELVEPIAARQEKLLVFTQFREMTDQLHDHLARCFGRPGLILHGGTPVKKRAGLVADFQADDGPTIPARFRVYPAEPAPQGDRMIAAVLVWVALVLALIAIGSVVASWR